MNKHLDYALPMAAILESQGVPTVIRSVNRMSSEFIQQEGCMVVHDGLKRGKRINGREKMFAPSFLEPMIKDGFPKGSNVSLIGPPGVGKTILCESLANDFLRNGGNCLYVTLDKTPDEVRNNFEKGNGFSRIKKRLVFVDGFSWLIGKSQEIYRVENLANLTELSIRISSAAYDLHGPTLLIFDSVSPLVVYNPENVVVKFLQLLLARIKDWNGMGIYVVQEGVHSSEFCNTLGYLVDGIFDMKMQEEKGKITRYFRIRSLKFAFHETRWKPFVIQTGRRIKFKRTRGGD